jgi:hypothetical protein
MTSLSKPSNVSAILAFAEVEPTINLPIIKLALSPLTPRKHFSLHKNLSITYLKVKLSVYCVKK